MSSARAWRQRQRQNRDENRDRRPWRRRAEARHEPLNAAAEEQHHHGIEQEQRQRGEQDRPAQILRLADAVDFMARIGERREIERRQAIGGRQRVDGDEAFGRAVKARRMIGRGACGIIRRHRPRGRRRRDEIAETVEHAARRHHFAHALGLRLGGVGDAGGAGERDDAPEHFDESAGQRQIGPARVAGDVEQHDQALAAARGGDQRRAIGQRRPSIVAQRGVGLRQDLARDGDVARHRHAVERALAGKCRQRLRLVPAQTAAEDAAAAPQLYGHQIVIGRGEPGAGETHQHAAVLDPARQAIVGVAGDIADVGEDQHGQVLIEEMRHRVRRRFALREPHVGEGIERPHDVIARRQQRFRQFDAGAGGDADGAAAPALVEQLHGAGGTLAGNLDPGDVVADLDRQRELRLGLAIRALERKGRFAERQALQIERARRAGVRGIRRGAQHLHAERACGIVGRGQRVRAGNAAVDDGDRAVVEGLRQRLDEVRAAAEIGAVGQPHQIDVVHGGEELGNRRQRFRAIDRVRLRLHLVQADARRARGLERNVARALRKRNERHGAAIVLGAGDDVVGGAHAGVPRRGSRPAVVDHDSDRAARGRRRQRRMPQRAGGGDDDQSGERKPHQGEPPRRAGGRFLFGRDFEQ